MNSFLTHLIGGLYLTSITTFSLGIFVFFESKNRRLGLIFFFYCFSLFWWSFFEAWLVTNSDYKNALIVAKLMEFGAFYIPTLFVHFVLILLEAPKPGLKLLFLYGLSTFIGILCFTPLVITNVVPRYYVNYMIVPGPFYLPILGFFVISVVYGNLKLFEAYRATPRNSSRKNQMGYLFWSSVGGYLGGSVNFLLVFDYRFPVLNDYGSYAVSIYVAATTYAIVRYQLMDIKTVIHKTVLWIGTSSALLMPIAVMLYLTSTWIGQLTPTQLSLFVWAVTILLIPYVKFIQPKIDHVFQRRKYDMQKTLQSLIRELAGLKNVDHLFSKIAVTIQEALYVSKTTLIILDNRNQNFKVIGNDEKINLDDPCLLFIKEINGVIVRDEIELNPKYVLNRPLARAYFKKFDSKVILPLIHDGKLVGLINLGEKDNLKPFSKMDIDFLTNLKTQASISLSNSLLYENVHRMSEEMKQWSVELEQKVNGRTRELAESKKELEESYVKLQELDKVKTEFFANVSHELRTPLTLILLPLEMALNKEFGEINPDLQKALTTVKTNGLRLLNLINGLLDLAKTDAGKMELFRNKYDLSLLIQSILSSLSLIADKKNIRLLYEERQKIPDFYFDREKIERVFINIISNALKFTDADGTINISLDMNDGFVEARVKDTGIGIPEKSIKKIFERFTQVDSSSSRKYQGTGLGLALCKEFVELHGGSIRAESQLGEGSTFILTLPISLNVVENADPVDRRVRDFETNVKRRNEDLTKTLSISALYESSDFERNEGDPLIQNELSDVRYKILLVEDNSQMRDYISSILKKEFSVITAQNGVEGLEKVKTFNPDLVVSDIMMPLKDGFQLCKELKTAPESRHIPIILLTAKSELSNKIEGLEVGANEYISKPFNASELLARVRSLLQLKELEKENAMSKKMAAMAVMVAGVIHEINNPISFTKTSWSTISESVAKLKDIIRNVEFKEKKKLISDLFHSTDIALDIVHKGIERIQSVVNRLRVFDGRQSLQFETIQLNDLLNRLTARIEEGFTDSQKELIQFQKEFQLQKSIEGIPVLLNQTFEVIIDNAIKSTHRSGIVKIKTWQGGEGNVCVLIKDNGCGIKKEKLEHLFEPFFTMRDVGSGMGLGLFLAHQVIQAHHGTVTVNSVENEGTEITIQLPLNQPQNLFSFQQNPYQSRI